MNINGQSNAEYGARSLSDIINQLQRLNNLFEEDSLLEKMDYPTIVSSHPIPIEDLESQVEAEHCQRSCHA